MESFKIITNTTADLPLDYIKEHHLGLYQPILTVIVLVIKCICLRQLELWDAEQGLSPM